MDGMTRASEALTWLGRQGTRAIAAIMLITLAIPQLSDWFRPAVGPSVFCLLVLIFMRVEPAAFRDQFRGRHLTLLLLAALVGMVLTPFFLGAIYVSIDGGGGWEELTLALMLQATAPPIMSAPAFAAFLGLNPALSLALLVSAITITPVTAPFFTALFFGDALPLDPMILAARLAFFLGGSFVLARAIRYWFGAERIRARHQEIDGLNILALFVFAASVMGVVTYRFIADPGFVLAVTALSFVIAIAITLVTTAIFWTSGRERALTIGITSGTRNMGLMLAAASAASDTVWLYVGIAQLPIYLAPWLLYPIVQRIVRQ